MSAQGPVCSKCLHRLIVGEGLDPEKVLRFHESRCDGFPEGRLEIGRPRLHPNADELELTEDDEGFEPGPNDEDPANVAMRAGYLRGLSSKVCDDGDRIFLRRASRSLIAFARRLERERGPEVPPKSVERDSGKGRPS